MLNTYWDDDPDEGPPRYIIYSAVNVTGPGSISLIGDYVQKRHPLELIRRMAGGPDSVKGHRLCSNDCGRVAGPGRPTCSQCRGGREFCACGRVKSRGSARCVGCTKEDRRIRKQMVWR